MVSAINGLTVGVSKCQFSVKMVDIITNASAQRETETEGGCDLHRLVC